jgi:hypothetical protein
MTTAHQCSLVMRLFVFVALAFGFVGFLRSAGATASGSPALGAADTHLSWK